MKLRKTVCPKCQKEQSIPAQKTKVQCSECGQVFDPFLAIKSLTHSQVIDQGYETITNLFDEKMNNIEGKEFGRYRVIEEIGAGGMGKVYRAYDSQLRRMVALKLTISGEKAKEKETQRFLREARATASLQHPNIITVLDIGQRGGQYFFAMELIEGISLKKFLQNTPVSLRRKIAIFKKIVQAIGYAHKQGVIHRDLKPANVMMDKDQNPIVMDFGLAKVRQASKKLSQSGMLIGTLQYMPPEQAEGRTREIDDRSDIYSLGAILYEILTGTPPFTGSTLPNILYQVLNKDPLPPQKVKKRIPKDLNVICLKALEKKKENRYQNISELVEDLTSFQNGKRIKVKSLSWSRSIKKHKSIFAFLMMALVLFFTYYAGQASRPEVKEISQKIPEKISEESLKNEEEPSKEISPPKTQKEEQISEGFKYLRTKQYSCAGIKNDVKEYQNIDTGIEFVLIPSGSFMMGSDQGKEDEKPIHQVKVKSFLLSKYEVTQKKWEEVMGNNPSGFTGAKKPVEQVSWNNVQKFCLQTRLRLPSEAEWEYACRGGTTSKYYWGNAPSDDYSNYGTSFTIEVGKKKPNSFGLFDMSGNVWEWCQDNYGNSYLEAPLNGTAWIQNGGRERVFRGGGWESNAFNSRSSSRSKFTHHWTGSALGFRVAKSLMLSEDPVNK